MTERKPSEETHEKPALPSLAELREAVDAMERDVAGRVGPVTHWEGCTSDPAHWRCKYAATFRAWLAALEKGVEVWACVADDGDTVAAGKPWAHWKVVPTRRELFSALLIPLTEADA